MTSATELGSGRIAEGVIATLLRAIYVERRSGWLRLSRQDERQSLRFRRGHITNAHTNVVVERLGETMVRHGRLSAADLERATAIVVREGRRLGEVLTELGLVDASGLQDAVALHVHEMLTKLFTWADGDYCFEPEQDTPEGEITLKLSTGELILEAVRAIRDPAVVHNSLGDMQALLALSSDPLLRFQKLTLSPTDGFVLSRVDGSTSAHQILQIIPLPAEDVERSLLGLLSTGTVESVADQRRRGAPAAEASGQRRPLEPRPAPASPPAPAPPPPEAAAPRVSVPTRTETNLPPSPAPSASPQAPSPRPGPTSPPPAAAPVRATQGGDAAPASVGENARPHEDAAAQLAERRREILATADAIKTQNHFEVLGLARTSTDTDVKEAYFRLAKRFHPDVHHDASLSDLRDTLEAVFIRLGEAYQVLHDVKRRTEYESRLGRARTNAAETPQAEPAGPVRDAAAEAALAEANLRRATAHFEKEQYWDAIRALEPLVPTLEGRLRTRGSLVLARCYLKNPNWARRAEELLLSTTREDAQAFEAWALLGSIYEGKGMRTRALSMYRKVLELKPDHEEAGHFVAASTPDELEPEEPKGILRKLFRKP